MTLDNFVFRYSAAVLLLVCLFTFGCSRNVKVTGTVTYSDTGEPVKLGMVIFTGDKEAGRGTITDGKYSVGLIKDGEGIPRGTYTVSSDAYEIIAPPSISMGPPGGAAGMSSPQTNQTAPVKREVYYTKEPKTLDVKKSMSYDFQVERGSQPSSVPR